MTQAGRPFHPHHSTQHSICFLLNCAIMLIRHLYHRNIPDITHSKFPNSWLRNEIILLLFEPPWDLKAVFLYIFGGGPYFCNTALSFKGSHEKKGNFSLRNPLTREENVFILVDWAVASWQLSSRKNAPKENLTTGGNDIFQKWYRVQYLKSSATHLNPSGK